MAKARREVQEQLKLVDFVIELVDARAPYSSQNPMLQEVLGQKPKLVLLMKKDLADPSRTLEWIESYQEKGVQAAAVDVNQKGDIQQVVQLAKAMGQEKMES